LICRGQDFRVTKKITNTATVSEKIFLTTSRKTTDRFLKVAAAAHTNSVVAFKATVANKKGGSRRLRLFCILVKSVLISHISPSFCKCLVGTASYFPSTELRGQSESTMWRLFCFNGINGNYILK